ncbi:3-oxoacyl-[acyl-carrier-protein] synthase III C-terminal domain-containing protein [Candidatus Rhabdochlamydia sp. T3358]|uniref:3-oxoacyl-[acyl-carrier-protein] synthase III C-terminal domain-containing protein n=1 Tax=Candidatus Rhabdochlamydia sp. T3358 TaxID=2099795 RepID=UPI0010B95116|nr:3-oxoacyl-[acyl-carrier-protein] synthase III C-terminal domain-containing protein [Candidatus Rhabdochlamydia sp. T3358]VHN99472.1 Alpha-pyrone synthesis polyketide synthase-like Pks18 [Candidatus Rhabdochlamydia sp. T3358]
MLTLSQFEIIRPVYESSQEETLHWLIQAHTQSEAYMQGKKAEQLQPFTLNLKQKLDHVACKPNRISKRGHVLSDFLHTEWEKMKVYRLEESSFGVDLTTRSKIFSDQVEAAFEQFYPKSAISPDHLIHVTCTGYVSPSGGQKMVSQRGWGEKTVVSHVYHMGCSASIPALRLAQGSLQTESCIDIVHTEICSLHTNPSLHELNQLVSQSLFADGFIKYRAQAHCSSEHFQLYILHEELVSNSFNAMHWKMENWGFALSLSQEIPALIAQSIYPYLVRMSQKSGFTIEYILQNAIFAIHPGGPKIVQSIQAVLGLSFAQVAHSKLILQQFGNMSSATLPHVWKEILEDPKVVSGSLIISLAFGPGLTICGSIMEKRLPCG